MEQKYAAQPPGRPASWRAGALDNGIGAGGGAGTGHAGHFGAGAEIAGGDQCPAAGAEKADSGIAVQSCGYDDGGGAAGIGTFRFPAGIGGRRGGFGAALPWAGDGAGDRSESTGFGQAPPAASQCGGAAGTVSEVLVGSCPAQRRNSADEPSSVDSGLSSRGGKAGGEICGQSDAVCGAGGRRAAEH